MAWDMGAVEFVDGSSGTGVGGGSPPTGSGDVGSGGGSGGTSGGGTSSGGGEHAPESADIAVAESMSSTISYMIANLLNNDGVSLTTSSEDSTYPIANLVDGDLANPLIYTNGGIHTITIDLGSPQPFNTLLIGAHNILAGATVTVKAGNTAAPTTVVGTANWTRDYIAVALGNQTARYITVEITGGAVGDRIGEMGLGTRIDLPGRWLLGRGFGQQEVTISQKTIRNVKHNYRLATFEKRDYTFRFTSAADEEAFRTFHRNTEGIITPFWLIEDMTTSKVWFGNKEDNLDFNETDDKANPPRNTYRLVFEESSKGAFISP